jgi:ABC-2 type transport system permease protein
LTNLKTRLRRGLQISRAFFDMGFSTAIAYPLSFGISMLQPMVPVATFFFVAQLVADGPSVGGDYFSFVIIGFLVTRAYGGALGGFASEMHSAVQQGRFEMLLVEPVRWRLLPFGMAQWQLTRHIFVAAIAASASLLLGFEIRWNTLPLALTVFLLGLLASLAIGILSGAVSVLSKRSNPVLTVYNLVAGILAGVAFPIELLPTPIRALSWLIPHTYSITAMRRLLLFQGDTVPGPTVNQALIALTLFNLFMYPLVMWVYGRIMETGRRTGVLHGY